MAFKLAQSFQNRTLAVYRSRLDQQKTLLSQIRNDLPLPLAEHVLHCVANEKKLLVYTDSAVWASQLRFYKDQLLQAACKTRSEPVEKLQVKLFTEQLGENKNKAEKTNLPSAERISLLREQGEGIEDSQLRLALQKLSATLARLAGQ
ncbi:MAG: DciA family protein [Gammaproteobacteria bacterium]